MTLKRLLIVVGLVFCQAGMAEPVPEYVMKATYLYNFAVFTEWPQSGGDTFSLCILGQDNFGPALNEIEGKKVNGLRLSVIRLSSLQNIKSCHMVFVGAQEAQHMHKILAAIDDAPVLTVTDAPVQSASGAMIAMTLDGRHLTFDIDADAARHAQLNIRSKLLQLARNLR